MLNGKKTLIMSANTMDIGQALISRGGNPLSQVNLAENDNNYPSREIEFPDIDGWGEDSEVGDYWVNRIISSNIAIRIEPRPQIAMRFRLSRKPFSETLKAYKGANG